MLVLVQTVSKGDIIVERISGKKRMTPVRKIEVNACSKPSVHINTRDCYDWGTYVEIAMSDETLGDLEEALENLEEGKDEGHYQDMMEVSASRI
jgi:hypothetical protein